MRTRCMVPRALAGARRSRPTPPCRQGRSCTFSAPVATTGRRRPGGLAAALALGLLAAASAGCGGTRAGAPAAAGPAAGPALPPASGSATGPGGRAPGSPGGPGTQPLRAGRVSWQRFCAAPPDASLRAALRRPVPGSLQGEVVPLGASADGRTAYVSAWTPGFSGVAAMNVAAGHLRRIRAFPDPAVDQADGASGGRWLVWAETHSLRSLDNFTVYAWDSATGRLRRLGHSRRGRHGAPWPSPWHAPAVSGNHAAWAQGYGPGGEVEVMLANLATGKVSVVRRGHAQPPFFEPDQDQPAHAVLRLKAGANFAGLAIAPGSLAWVTTGATYLASTRTGVYTRVTRAYGDATGSGPDLVISDAPSEKAAHPVLQMHVLRPAGLTWRACR